MTKEFPPDSYESGGENPIHSRLLFGGGTAAAFSAAAAGAADTPGTPFLRPVQISAGQGDDKRDHREYDEISIGLVLPLLSNPYAIPRFGILLWLAVANYHP